MNTVCVSPPSLNLHTWADTDAAQVSLQIVSSRGIKTSAIMYGAALCLQACQTITSASGAIGCQRKVNQPIKT